MKTFSREEGIVLVLSRVVGQEVVVPSCNLVLTVLEVRGERVRLGIAAPAEVNIYRREVWERVQTELSSQEEAIGTSEEREGARQQGQNGSAHPAR